MCAQTWRSCIHSHECLRQADRMCDMESMCKWRPSWPLQKKEPFVSFSFHSSLILSTPPSLPLSLSPCSPSLHHTRARIYASLSCTRTVTSTRQNNNKYYFIRQPIDKNPKQFPASGLRTALPLPPLLPRPLPLWLPPPSSEESLSLSSLIVAREAWMAPCNCRSSSAPPPC